MSYLGRKSGRAALISDDIPDNSITAAKIVAGAVDADIGDNAVTLAKMAGGTDGQVITYDASGDPVAVGPGTDGQVLTSTGAGSPPAFEALPASTGTVTAWVNFDGTTNVGGNCTIRDDFGISSVTDKGTGIYWAVFDSARPDVNYAWASSVGEWDKFPTGAPSTTTHVVIYVINVAETYLDDDYVTVIVFGD